MSGFELRTSGIGSDRSTNRTTTTALHSILFLYLFLSLLLTSLSVNTDDVIGQMIHSSKTNLFGIKRRLEGGYSKKLF